MISLLSYIFFDLPNIFCTISKTSRTAFDLAEPVLLPTPNPAHTSVCAHIEVHGFCQTGNRRVPRHICQTASSFSQTDTVGSHGHIVINSMFTSSLEIFKPSVMGVKKHFLRLFQSCSNCSSRISRKGLYQVGQFCTLVNSGISVNSFLGFALLRDLRCC